MQLGQYKINLWGINTYGFGIAGGTLQYSSQGSHSFYNSANNNNTFNIDLEGTISCRGSLIVGNINSFPNVQLGSTNGNNIAIATTAGSFSTSSLANDMVIRSINRLLLQSGSGGYAILIDTNNAVIFPADRWIYSNDSTKQRLSFGANGRTYYQGYGNSSVLDINHEWRNHNGDQKMSLDFTGNLRIKGVLLANFLTIANTNRDLTGINIELTNTNDRNDAVLYCIQGTFTGFHRVYTEDENFNIEDPQKFKDDYEGRIVVSTGKIATDTTDDNDNKDNTEWRILQDKEGIAIEDALPKIELSRKRKDKRVFGVLGDKRRTNNRTERLIVNSVGEGAVWIINSNGNFENGDLITTSNYLGYGENQQTEFITNYTCGKITMSCDFQLDSELYQCKEIEEYNENGEKLKVAFVACLYYCG